MGHARAAGVISSASQQNWAGGGSGGQPALLGRTKGKDLSLCCHLSLIVGFKTLDQKRKKRKEKQAQKRKVGGVKP